MIHVLDSMKRWIRCKVTRVRDRSDAVPLTSRGTANVSFGNTVTVITGASSGIGAATALKLAQRGSKIVLAARNEERLQGLVTQITQAGGVASFHLTDVGDRSSVDDLIKFTVSTYGKVDSLVDNAGTGYRLRLPPDLEGSGKSTRIWAKPATAIQSCNGYQVSRIQCEIENVEVVPDARRRNRFWDCNQSKLQMPPNDDLCGCPVMLSGNVQYDWTAQRSTLA